MSFHLKPSKVPRLNKQSGTSLIEVLIAVLLLSVGMIAIAGLIGRSLAASNSAGYRAAAVRNAATIADAIRSNPQGASDGLYNTAMGSTPTGGTKAAQDLIAWKNAMKALPLGDGSIVVDGSRDLARISVRWSRGAAAASEYDTYDISFHF
jgi:type IV pilus assembly protein PilV